MQVEEIKKSIRITAESSDPRYEDKRFLKPDIQNYEVLPNGI